MGIQLELVEYTSSKPRPCAGCERLTTRLNQWADTRDYMGEVRGLGAMVACTFVQLGTDTPDADRAKRIQQAALQRGLLLLTCGVDGNVIRFLFPLTIEDAVFEEGLQVLEAALDA